MMRLHRATVVAQVKNLAPMHCGSGAVSYGGDGVSDSALIQKDCDGRPWIPGSTLKGALRAYATGVLTAEEIGIAFGAPGPAGEEDVSSGGQGCLTFLGAKTTERVPLQTSSRTRVHRGTGAAEANLLFSFQEVPEETTFDVTIVAHGPTSQSVMEHATIVAKLLAAFQADGGLPIGRGRSTSAGALKLLAKPTAVLAHFEATGWSEPQPLDLPDAAAAEMDAVEPLELHCPGPYLVKGDLKTEARHDDRNKTRDIQLPLRCADKKTPRLAESGIKGAMRTRARWLTELERHRGNTEFDSRRDCPTSAGQKPLDVIERVFGDEGRQGHLTFRVSGRGCKGVSRHPSVRLDPVSQAPYSDDHSGALYTIEADYGVTFKLHLAWRRPPASDERALLNLLLRDIEANGLKLGHGTTNGFGWFNCAPDAATGNWGIRGQRLSPRNLPSTRISDQAKALEWSFPDDRVTLPWRSVAIDKDTVAPMEEVVAATYAKATSARAGLHATPIEEGLSGHVDLSWVFETPVLIGGDGAVRSPVRVETSEDGKGYVLPGTTLRGYIRSVVTAAVNGRLSHVRSPTLGDRQKQCVFQDHHDAWKVSNHAPKGDASFRPDFVEALFGFIKEPDANAPNPLHHNLSHLKSRISFGFAALQGSAQVVRQPRVTMPGPQSNSYLYDGLGMKRYVPGQATTDEAYARLKAQRGNRDMESDVEFLEPADDEPLVFRGRIAFHNLTNLELGALFWALSCGGQPYGRHYLGTGRPFGFGACYCADFDTVLIPNNRDDVKAVEPVLADNFGAAGASFLSAFSAFNKALNGRFSTSFGQDRIKALKLSFEPAYAEALRKRAGLGPNAPGYQTTGAFADRSDRFQQKRSKVAAIAKSNVPEGSALPPRLASLIGRAKF